MFGHCEKSIAQKGFSNNRAEKIPHFWKEILRLLPKNVQSLFCRTRSRGWGFQETRRGEGAFLRRRKDERHGLIRMSAAASRRAKEKGGPRTRNASRHPLSRAKQLPRKNAGKKNRDHHKSDDRDLGAAARRWWRWRESNPRPKKDYQGFLRA